MTGHKRPLVVLLLAEIVACSREMQSPPASAPHVSAASLAGKSESTQPRRSMPRKVIRTLEIGLKVRDAAGFLSSLDAAVASSEGYVSDRDLEQGAAGVRSGRVTLRVPAEAIEKLRDTLRDLGTPESESMRAEEISDQYYDLAARLANARVLEQRLLKLLEEKTGQLSEIVTVESKLSEVREQIEQFEGRTRLWDTQVALATIHLTFHVAAAPRHENFVAELMRALKSSTERLISFAKGAALLATVLVPWFPILVLGGLIVRWRARRAKAA